MMREIKTCLDQEWEQLSTEELDQILQAELEKEYPNEEVVLPILRELEEREKDLPGEKTPEVLEIIEKLSKHETSSKPSIYKRRWLAGIAALAAVVCIVVMALPRTVGAESIFDVLFRWTSSVFEFLTPGREAANPPVEIIFETDNHGLQQLYEKVAEQGVTDPVVPMWLPEGFALSTLNALPAPGGYRVYGEFKKGTDNILITYRISTDIYAKVEKREAGVELFESSGNNHFIVENNGSFSVMWSVDGVECVINANVTKENIYTIIKSIYRSELTL